MRKNITIKEMLDLSDKLHDKYKDCWDNSPESNINWVCWLVGEVGEVIDIIKKKGADKIMNDETIRREMLLEITDCYMYLADIINRYKFTAEEFSEAYNEKMDYNLGRDYTKSTTKADKLGSGNL